MMTKWIALLFLSFAIFTPNLSYAQTALVDAKEQGIVGEMTNGMIGFVDESRAGDQLKLMVEGINHQRMKKYETIADKNDISDQQAQKLAGKTLIEKTPKGFYYQDIKGEWVKK